MTLESAIIQVVANKQGVKATELVTLLPPELLPSKFEVLDETLQKLIVEGKIVEIQYVLGFMKHRVKSFYLPQGSEVIE